MALCNEFIITLQCVKGIGLATIDKINEASEGNNIISIEDLHVLISDVLSAKKTPDYDALVTANMRAKSIITKSEALGIGMISRFDRNFPQNLLSTINESGKPTVPILLYYKGNLNIANKPSIAIIGTREPTPDGVLAAKHFAGVFASAGFNIVSGLAIGCDVAGHIGALDAHGVTTAFLAHGLDTIYPKENEGLARSIVENGGLLLSEYPIGTAVNKYNLIARDRLQAGLSDATLVIQTGIKGGTMHAANNTLVADKPLYVVKYKEMSSEKVLGNLQLQSKGAKFLTSSDTDQVIEVITKLKNNSGEFKIKTSLF